ncbi:VOC family protein [Streptomyces sp. NPDC058195]|uniref:VOC family protein n=1 Tax=Streptomyces sp. NPDC058195 TaxID=3346375 RepID=UPI0036E058A8
MPMGTEVEDVAFDHLLHYVPDVPEAVRAYSEAGLPAHANDVADGFRNGGWRLDERYVEILSVTDPVAVRASRYARGLDLLAPSIDALEGPAGAITFAVNVTDAHAVARALRARGHQTEVLEVELAEHGMSFVEVFIVDGPAWWPFFITYTPPRERSLANVPDAAFERGPYDLAGMVVTAPAPHRAASELGALLGLEATGHRVPLPGCAVEFEQGGREGITAITVTGPQEHASGRVLGLDIRGTP